MKRLTVHSDFENVPARLLLERVFTYMHIYRWRFYASLAISVLGIVVLSNLAPLVDRAIIDNHIATGNREGFVPLLILALLLHVITQVALGGRSILVGRVGHSIGWDMRRELFQHVHRLSFSFYDSVPVGSIMTRFLSDLSTIGEFVAWQLAGFINDCMVAIVVVVLMFVVDWQLALVVLVTLPALVGLGVVLRPRIHDGWELVRTAGSELNVFLAENISGMRVIQAFVRQNVNKVEFRRRNAVVVKHYMDVMRLQAWFPPMVELTRAAGLCAMLYVASQQLGVRPTLSVGVLVAFTTYINNLWTPINTITNMYVVLQSTLTSAQRAFAVLDTQPVVDDAPAAGEIGTIQGDVLLDHVSFGYDPARPVLHDVNLHIAPGEMVAFVGHTGSGKTTIAALVSRFYDVTAGGVFIDGVDVRSVTQHSLRSHMGTVQQEPFIFGDTIANNIRYGRPDASMDEVIAAARTANVHDFVMQLEDGYETQCKERGSQFSQGQRQLLSIARAILANPRILILDEATSAVDTNTEVLIQQALERLLAGRTSIIIAHRLSTIRRANQIFVMDSGRLVEHGTHDALLSAHGAYARLVAAQRA